MLTYLTLSRMFFLYISNEKYIKYAKRVSPKYTERNQAQKLQESIKA